jgi:hypothetical protein
MHRRSVAVPANVSTRPVVAAAELGRRLTQQARRRVLLGFPRSLERPPLRAAVAVAVTA